MTPSRSLQRSTTNNGSQPNVHLEPTARMRRKDVNSARWFRDVHTLERDRSGLQGAIMKSNLSNTAVREI